MTARLRAQQFQFLAQPGRGVRRLEQPLLRRGVQHGRRRDQVGDHRRLVRQVRSGGQGALAGARQPLLVAAEGPQHTLGSAPAPSPAPPGAPPPRPSEGPVASTESSRNRVVPVASTSKVPSSRSRMVAASAMQPTAWNAWTGSSPKPAAGPALGQRRVGSGMPGAVGATSRPSRMATTAKRRGSSSGRLQQFAHQGAVALLEDVQGQDETREQHRVQREERKARGGHGA